jgi:hypothetical protein
MKIENVSKTKEQDEDTAVEIRELTVTELDHIGGGHGVIQQVITP